MERFIENKRNQNNQGRRLKGHRATIDVLGCIGARGPVHV